MIDFSSFYFTLYEIILGIVFALITVFILKKILFNFLFKSSDGFFAYEQNLAISIVSGTIIISVLILVHSCLLPAIDVFRTLSFAQNEITIATLGISFLYFLLFYVVAVLFSVIVLLASVKVFTWATRNIDEFAELKNHNLAVAILLSFVIIGIAISVKPALQHFIGSLVNYESFENITWQHSQNTSVK